MVGFHHIVGSQIEYVYPPLDDKDKSLTQKFLDRIAQQSLPDGSHLQDQSQVYFILNDENNLFHCVSSYGQIEAKLLPQEDSISRTFVQKAVCIVTKVPIYGLLADKVRMAMNVLFDQRNFKETKILEDLYNSSNSFTMYKEFTLIDDIRDQYIGLNLKPILKAQDYNILTIFKLMLLEGRILVYSHNSQRLSQFMYSLIGLFPGLLTFKFANSR